jgi:hypothetical protein
MHFHEDGIGPGRHAGAGQQGSELPLAAAVVAGGPG